MSQQLFSQPSSDLGEGNEIVIMQNADTPRTNLVTGFKGGRREARIGISKKPKSEFKVSGRLEHSAKVPAMRPFAVGRSRISTASGTWSLLLGFSNGTSRQLKWCTQCRYNSTGPAPGPEETEKPSPSFPKESEHDDWYNVPLNIKNSIAEKLHVKKDHPLSITRSIIESQFPPPTFKYYNNKWPVVSTYKNFDSLGIPPDHVGRSKTDTYYVNKDTVLRTHTSAHQHEVFKSNASRGFLISADVYRRDAIDRSHYPIFHQMEGARTWDRESVVDGNLAAAIWKDVEALPRHSMVVEDPNPTVHAERNPLQDGHTIEEAEAIAAHLKRSIELVVAEIFSRAKAAAIAGNPDFVDEPLKVRWIEAYFPFTSPSWELEVFWQGDWLEVLGCGVVKQELLANAGMPTQSGWAFGMGLERIAMLLFEIPDIRLFWSKDERFLSQFAGVSENLDKLKRFVPFSKYPACYKDVAFWLRSSSSSAGGGLTANSQDFHENDLMEIIREVGGNIIENVTQTDAFTHPTTGRKSLCYRINYRSVERTLTNKETNEYHDMVRSALVEKLGVELR